MRHDYFQFKHAEVELYSLHSNAIHAFLHACTIGDVYVLLHAGRWIEVRASPLALVVKGK